MSILSHVYKNLNNGKWSIKQRVEGKWLVVGHCDACQVINSHAHVSEASRLRMIRLLPKRGKEVHAWVVGDLVNVVGFESFRGRVVNRDPDSYVERMHDLVHIHYRPFESGIFSDSLGIEWDSSRRHVADFSKFGQMYVGES